MSVNLYAPRDIDDQIIKITVNLEHHDFWVPFGVLVFPPYLFSVDDSLI